MIRVGASGAIVCGQSGGQACAGVVEGVDQGAVANAVRAAFPAWPARPQGVRREAAPDPRETFGKAETGRVRRGIEPREHGAEGAQDRGEARRRAGRGAARSKRQHQAKLREFAGAGAHDGVRCCRGKRRRTGHANGPRARARPTPTAIAPSEKARSTSVAAASCTAGSPACRPTLPAA